MRRGGSRHQGSCHKRLLEVTQGQILSQSPTDATRLWWHVWELTKATINFPLG